MRDDDLHDRLARLVADAGLALPDFRNVRARGDRRRARVPVVAAGLSIAVAAGVVGAAWSTAGTLTASLPAGVGVGGPSALPSSNAIAPASVAPAPSGDLASSYPQSPDPTSGPPIVTKIPASLSMLHERQPGWTTDNSPNVPSAFNPCGHADVTVAGRTDARTLTGPGLPIGQSRSPSKVTHQLFLYATDQAATTAFVGLSAGGCGWAKTVMNPGDGTSTHLARLHKEDSYNPQPGVYWLHDTVMVRTRNALLIIYADTGGAGMSSNTADQEIDNILGPLCGAHLVCR